MRILIALGGNALVGPNESVRPDHQIAAAESAAGQVAQLVTAGHQVLLSHGNGPQVGNILAKNDLASFALTPVPLDWCVANSQGSIGEVLLNALDAALLAEGSDVRSVVLVSRTLVAADDPAFDNPTKPIGRFVDEETAGRLTQFGQHYVRIDDKGLRRVVASPQPIEIIEAPAVESLLAAGFLVVAAGGGGIPVIRHDDGTLHGVQAVVDKDLSSILLADQISADALVIATNVDNAWLDWGKETARPLHEVRLEDMRRYLAEGQFPPGSMGPKVESACRFVERTGAKAVITSLERISGALTGEAGTIVVP
ncbi:MAG: carbamate kinase [Tessaracoccus sp.]|uniref:carbamate kinase n=1 Tax=Tessaracoccus sp. TaxID=1971211 RepID=UPI001EB10E6B|nr:carbamate kinase [Tessaracoccus sp.]MBK7821011.1 carbamate kinase [Tessaracoccus sp.]